jgi:hypothetical protein
VFVKIVYTTKKQRQTKAENLIGEAPQGFPLITGVRFKVWLIFLRGTLSLCSIGAFYHFFFFGNFLSGHVLYDTNLTLVISNTILQKSIRRYSLVLKENCVSFEIFKLFKY